MGRWRRLVAIKEGRTVRISAQASHDVASEPPVRTKLIREVRKRDHPVNPHVSSMIGQLGETREFIALQMHIVAEKSLEKFVQLQTCFAYMLR